MSNTDFSYVDCTRCDDLIADIAEMKVKIAMCETLLKGGLLMIAGMFGMDASLYL